MLLLSQALSGGPQTHAWPLEALQNAASVSQISITLLEIIGDWLCKLPFLGEGYSSRYTRWGIIRSEATFSSEPRRPVAPESRHPGVPEPRLPGVPEPRLPGAPESPQGCPVLSDSLRLFYLIFCREGA